ncbi:DNA topoisomerase [Bifidobacterium moukalabense]|uniref:DNA topoisomerase n=1 Tax=Bifidobacterium moukalabense TaxID=1333651 RepID=UPI0010F7A7BC
MGSWTLESDRIGDGSHARTVPEDAKSPAIVVDHVERRRECTSSPTLFYPTGLQKVMNSRHGLTAEQTLAALQHLHEMKAATYPRTDSSLPSRVMFVL